MVIITVISYTRMDLRVLLSHTVSDEYYWHASSGWGNGELECYTNSSSNLAIIQDPASPANGLLSITALFHPNYNCYNLQVRLQEFDAGHIGHIGHTR
jgi:hypothetical protein